MVVRVPETPNFSPSRQIFEIRTHVTEPFNMESHAQRQIQAQIDAAQAIEDEKERKRKAAEERRLAREQAEREAAAAEAARKAAALAKQAKLLAGEVEEEEVEDTPPAGSKSRRMAPDDTPGVQLVQWLNHESGRNAPYSKRSYASEPEWWEVRIEKAVRVALPCLNAVARCGRPA